jgi:hypothetical protein
MGAEVVRASPRITLPEKEFFSVNTTGIAAQENVSAKRIVSMFKIDRKYFELCTTYEVRASFF